MDTIQKRHQKEIYLSMLNSAYQANQKLHATSQHWQSRAKQYQKKANFLFFLFIAFVILLAYGVSKLPNEFILTTEVNTPQFLIYGIYLTLCGLGIWIARTILKHAFKNFYLKENAHEKETIILSYLALKEGGAGVESSEGIVDLETNLIKL